jgi:uncharacterized SAM-binding protein YcdF (DUF218 family)
MNDLFMMFGIESWKPVLSGLLMPPLPFLVLTIVGARLMFRQRLLAWALVLLGVGGAWASCTTAVGVGLMRVVLDPPPVLGPADLAALKKPPAGTPKTTIVVLGGGRELLAPEFGVSNLKRFSMERLRYGVWLGRETGLPIGFAGGHGHGAEVGPSEAEIAQRIAEREFGRRLQWIETTSRDTNQNAIHSLRLLKEFGYERIVLVTHGFHMQRAVANFERAANRAGQPLTILPAPMGMSDFAGPPDTGWLPGSEGLAATRIVLHEWLGRLMGA